MKRLVLAAGAALFISTAAHADIIPVLDSVTPSGLDWLFSYSGTLAGDQGLVPGSELIVYDFEGYVAGSIDAGIYAADVNAFTENTSALPLPPGFTDDPLIPNLVFRWKGAPFNASGGPFSDVSFSGLSAKSTFSNVKITIYAGTAVTNNGAATGFPTLNYGSVGAPSAAVPEPSLWAMMIAGFGGAGVILRNRRRALAS